MGQDEQHGWDTARADRSAREDRCEHDEQPECDERRGTPEDDMPSPDFPDVPARDVGIGHTSDVDPPPNTGEEPPDVPGTPG